MSSSVIAGLLGSMYRKECTTGGMEVVLVVVEVVVGCRREGVQVGAAFRDIVNFTSCELGLHIVHVSVSAPAPRLLSGPMGVRTTGVKTVCLSSVHVRSSLFYRLYNFFISFFCSYFPF